MIDLCRPYLDFSETYINMCLDLDHHPWKIRSKHREANKDGMDHEYQGWACGKAYDSYKRGQTYTWKYRTPGAYATADVGPSNEKIHASVRERWNTLKGPWRPKSLEGFVPTQQEDGKWEWVKKDKRGNVVSTIEEELFDAPEGSFEWLLKNSPATPRPADWK
jgi:hypothetical protein